MKIIDRTALSAALRSDRAPTLLEALPESEAFTRLC